MATPTRTTARRFRGLPCAEVAGRHVPVAVTRRARLLGLSLLDGAGAGSGLLIPGCRSVHTFGMRFELDLVFLDRSLRAIAARRRVRPWRFVFEPRACAVLELPVPARVEGA